MMEYPQLLLCCISHDAETDLVSTKCFHVFGQNNLSQWLANNTTCPICREHLEVQQLNYLDKSYQVLEPKYLKGYLAIYDTCVQQIIAALNNTKQYKLNTLTIIKVALSKEIAHKIDLLDSSKENLLSPEFKLLLLNTIAAAVQEYLLHATIITQQHVNELIQQLPNFIQEINTLYKIDLKEVPKTIMIKDTVTNLKFTTSEPQPAVTSIRNSARVFTARSWWHDIQQSDFGYNGYYDNGYNRYDIYYSIAGAEDSDSGYDSDDESTASNVERLSYMSIPTQRYLKYFFSWLKKDTRGNLSQEVDADNASNSVSVSRQGLLFRSIYNTKKERFKH